MRRYISSAIALICVLCTAFTAFISCGEEEDIPERKSRTTYDYFDTVATLYSFSGDSDESFGANFAAFEAELSLCHRLFDIYNEYDGINNAATVNKNAGIAPVKVDKRLIDLALFSKEMYERTGGAVNVAMGAVLKIWHNYRTAGTSVPTEEELFAAAEHCDISKLVIDTENSTLFLSDPQMSIDLGAVAKGYAIDLAAAVLRQRGAVSYAIDVGGNLYAIGAKYDGSPFKTGVENPLGGSYSAYIDVSDGAVATSGDYQRYYLVDGVIYHHIINGTTLFPARFHRSVTVYSDSAALSDALSTALFNMLRLDAEALIRAEFPTVREVVFVGDDGVGSSFKP